MRDNSDDFGTHPGIQQRLEENEQQLEILKKEGGFRNFREIRKAERRIEELQNLLHYYRRELITNKIKHPEDVEINEEITSTFTPSEGSSNDKEESSAETLTSESQTVSASGEENAKDKEEEAEVEALIQKAQKARLNKNAFLSSLLYSEYCRELGIEEKPTFLFSEDALENTREDFIQKMKTHLWALKKAAEDQPQMLKHLHTTYFPRLRERMYQVSIANDARALANHFYDFFYKDLRALKKVLEKSSKKILFAMEAIEADIRETSKRNKEVAELFFLSTYSRIELKILKIIQYYSEERIPEINADRDQKNAKKNGGSSYELKSLSVQKLVRKILDFIDEKKKLPGLYEEKVAEFVDLCCMLKRSVLFEHMEDFLHRDNPTREEQREIRFKIAEIQNKSVDRSKDQEESGEEAKILHRSLTQYKTTELKENLKLCDDVIKLFNHELSLTAPTPHREEAQTSFQNLLYAQNLCMQYFREKQKSVWFENIAGAFIDGFYLKDSFSLPLFTLNAYNSFLETKRDMLDATIKQKEGRSKLFNSRSLSMINEILDVLHEELSKLNIEESIQKNAIRGNEEYKAKLLELNKASQMKETEIDAKTTEVNKKYFSYFFGFRKPKFGKDEDINPQRDTALKSS